MVKYVDRDYLIQTRRQLHQCPEVGYDLPETSKLVGEKLREIGLTYTDRYAPCSLVCDINPEKTGYTIALRADMDALCITEKTGLPFASKREGYMHACGHDTHTACLLAAARALYAMRDEIPCRVRLIFQPNEEGPESAPALMIRNGILDGVDIVVGQHVSSEYDSGKIGIRKGPLMASCRNFTVTVYGKTAHATIPQSGRDALAAAVDIYNHVQFLRTRQVDPLQNCICAVSSLQAGNAYNIVPDMAVMKGTIRTYDVELDRFLYDSVCKIADSCAALSGCTCKTESSQYVSCLMNDETLCNEIWSSAEKIVGAENVMEIAPMMSSEDFADFSVRIPSVFFYTGVGTGPMEKRARMHNSDFNPDEDALENAANLFVQFVLDKAKKQIR